MKKLLFIFLLFISMLTQGQMIITDHKAENAFGYQVTYRLYEPKIHSDNYVIFFHGIGEVGPLDGSKLYLVEKNKGFPRSAKEGFNFNFNIIAIQVATSYSQVKKFILPYIKFKYGAKRIFVTGLSMGGIATYEILLNDDYDLIDGAAAVCGRASPLIAIMLRNDSIRAYHGDADTKVTLSSDQAFIRAYNDTHPASKIKLTVYPGVGHNAWDYAYSLEPGKDDLYQFVLKIFSQPLPATPCEQTLEFLREFRYELELLTPFIERCK